MALSDNLVAYYKLDESSGDATDATGNGWTLTNTSVTYSSTAPNILNNYGVFNGGSSKLTTASTGYNLSGDFSISLWMYSTDMTTYPWIFHDWDNNKNNIFYIIYDNGGGTGKMNYYRGNGGTSYAGGSLGGAFATTLNVNTWYHLVITQSGTTAKFYVNNASPETNTMGYSGGATNTYNHFGGYTSDWLAGRLDEIGVWSRAITATEVSDLYNGGAGLAYPFAGAAVFRRKALLGVGQ